MKTIGELVYALNNLFLFLQGVSGSGPGGRIVSKDLPSVQPVAPSVAPPLTTEGDYTDIDLSNMRKVRPCVAYRATV